MIVTAKQYHAVPFPGPRNDDQGAKNREHKRELIESLDPERRVAVDRLMKACGSFPDRSDMFCGECQHFHVVPCQSTYEGECRIGPPSKTGFRRVRPVAWCSRFKRGAAP